MCDTNCCVQRASYFFVNYFLFIHSFSGQKLYDGRPLGGRGRLTLPRVDAMQVFYGRVLRSTHLSATEKQQQHHYSEGATHEHCPAGPDSWCKWQHDVARGTSTYRPPYGRICAGVCDDRLIFNHVHSTTKSNFIVIFLQRNICVGSLMECLS